MEDRQAISDEISDGKRGWCCDTRYMFLYGGGMCNAGCCRMHARKESNKGKVVRPAKESKLNVGSFSAFQSSWGSPWSVFTAGARAFEGEAGVGFGLGLGLGLGLDQL